MTFSDILQSSTRTAEPVRVAVVQGTDEATRSAALRAESTGLVKAVFVTDDDPRQAAARAVQMVRHGEADFLMKGLLHTADLLRAILNKETGILPQGSVLTHVAATEIPTLGRIIFYSDAAVIPAPTPEQRAEQIRILVDVAHRLGIAVPRVALLHCAETVSEKFPHTLSYPDLVKRAQQGEWGDCLVDGPLDLRCSLDAGALQTKGIASPLEGKADILLVPDIEAGNVLYKALTFLVPATRTAGFLAGAACPVVLSSRGDDAETKYLSLLLASATASRRDSKLVTCS